MGWLNWIGGAGGRGRRGRKRVEMEAAAAAASSKCMCSVFQLFDFYHLNRLPHLDSHPSFLEYGDGDEQVFSSTGVEAPRNSLELPMKEEEESLNFPVGIRIKTDHRRLSSSEAVCDSPGAKTPNLIARLMGLDLLPDCSSPSIHSSQPKLLGNFVGKDFGRRRAVDDTGVRSLPETPRISSGRISDVECHRLSLQINKVSANPADFDLPALRRANVSRNENVNPGRYGKMNLHRGKSRSFDGVDISNTRRNRDLARIDEDLVIKNWKKDFRECVAETPPETGVPTRIKPKISTEKAALLKPRNIISGEISPRNEILCTKPLTNKTSALSLKENNIDCINLRSPFQQKKNKTSTDRGNLSQRVASRSPGLIEQRSSKKIGFEIWEKSNRDEDDEAFLISTPRYVCRGLPQKQSQVSGAVSSQSCTQFSSKGSQRYRPLTDKIFKTEVNSCGGYSASARASPGPAPAAAEDEYEDIITKTLQLPNYTNLSTVLHRLGKYYSVGSSSVLRHRHRCSYTKLISRLLRETLRTQQSVDSEACRKIDSFCAASCEGVESIDLAMQSEMQMGRLCGLTEEEDEGIVVEIERGILEHLVSDTAAVVTGCCG